MLNKLKEKLLSVRNSLEEATLHSISPKVSLEIQMERYSICESCEFLFKPTSSCRKCGCFMKLKTWIPEQRCPINKWGPVEPEIKKTGD